MLPPDNYGCPKATPTAAALAILAAKNDLHLAQFNKEL